MTSPFIQQIADNRVCQVITCLPEKFVVDFANGIDVAQEHIRTAGERTFFRRLKEGLTGEGAARQNAINASVAQGLEASLRWLTELTTSLATTNYAITRVNDRVSSLVSDTARLAHYSADTREQLLIPADQVHHKLNHLEEKLHRVDQFSGRSYILSRYSHGGAPGDMRHFPLPDVVMWRLKSFAGARLVM